ANDMLGHFRPPPALGHQDIQLGFADADEREFSGDKKSVQQDQHQDGQDFQRVKNDGVPVHNFTSPNISFKMSSRLTTPSSLPSRASTMASRSPARCIRRSATSSRVSSPRNNAGVMCAA